MTNIDVISDANEILELAYFFETDADLFQLAGTCPSWILGFCPELSTQDTVILRDAFVFLGSFIEQSREFFIHNSSRSITSGPWSERDSDNIERNLSATAINLDHCLAIQLQHISKEKLHQRKILQKSREYGLNFERLQREKEQKETLVYAIVHDLAGPLTAISGIVELLRNTDADKFEQGRLLTNAKSHVDNTHKMIRSILEVFDAQEQDFSADRLEAELAPQILHIAVSVVDEFDAVFRQQGVTLKLDCRLRNPNEKVISESEALTRVLVNLLDNALRYSPDKSQVTIIIDSTEDEVIISVVDQGQGVPDQLADSLFKRFVGGKTYGGKTGFGLYFCRMCVGKWGGRIRYVKAVDRIDDIVSGACFEVTLKKFQ